MNELSPLLVGVDFSASSRRALEVAAAIGARAGARLELVHVWQRPHIPGAGTIVPELDSWIARQKDVASAELDDWAAATRESGVEVSPRVIEGEASRVLFEVARSSKASLVVVGRRGSARLTHVLLGSVSERLVHLAPCPVLVVPGKTAVARSPERLVVGVDFSSASKDAYHAALGLAEQLGASRGLVLVHARPGERELQLANWSELAYRGEYRYDEAALKKWARTHRESHVPIISRILEGSPEEILVNAAEREDCDWLVLGLQGRTALAALLIGSTTDRILKLANRPVLVVPRTAPAPGELTNQAGQ